VSLVSLSSLAEYLLVKRGACPRREQLNPERCYTRVGQRQTLAYLALQSVTKANKFHNIDFTTSTPVHPAPPARLVVQVTHAAVLVLFSQVVGQRGKRKEVASKRWTSTAPSINIIARRNDESRRGF
jgi:hypothetical protein